MTNPNPAYGQSDTGLPPDEGDDLDEVLFNQIFRNLDPDDPVAVRRNDLRGWSEAAGFQNIDVRNLGEPDFWEMRFDRGTNDECINAAQAERWLGFIARGCRCRIVPGQFVAIVDGDWIAARFRLEPRPQPEPAA